MDDHAVLDRPAPVFAYGLYRDGKRLPGLDAITLASARSRAIASLLREQKGRVEIRTDGTEPETWIYQDGYAQLVMNRCDWEALPADLRNQDPGGPIAWAITATSRSTYPVLFAEDVEPAPLDDESPMEMRRMATLLLELYGRDAIEEEIQVASGILLYALRRAEQCLGEIRDGKTLRSQRMRRRFHEGANRLVESLHATDDISHDYGREQPPLDDDKPDGRGACEV